MFGYTPDAPFAAFPGGGTPFSSGTNPFPPVTNHSAEYAGVLMDSDKPATAIVYVDTTAPVALKEQQLRVTLKAHYV